MNHLLNDFRMPEEKRCSLKRNAAAEGEKAKRAPADNGHACNYFLISVISQPQVNYLLS